jgi:hypothetical protein
LGAFDVIISGHNRCPGSGANLHYIHEDIHTGLSAASLQREVPDKDDDSGLVFEILYIQLNRFFKTTRTVLFLSIIFPVLSAIFSYSSCLILSPRRRLKG